MRPILTALFCLTGCSLAQAASITVVRQHTVYEVAADGTWTTEIDVARRIDDAQAVSSAGQAPVQYSDSLQTLKILEAYTVTKDGKRIYAANGGAGSVSVIDPATNKVIKEIPVGKRPWNMALTPDSKKLYVANGRSNSVSVIDTGSLAVVKEIPVGELPWGVVISP